MATTFRRTVLFTASLAIAAGTWVISGQNTTSPQYETVRYTNDGLRLEAYLYTPAGPGPFALVIHRHSGNDPAPRWGAVIARLLTDAGYAVLVPQRRGSGSSEGQLFTESGGDRDRIGRLRAAFNTAETGDVLAALEAVTRDSGSRIRHTLFDREEGVSIWGHDVLAFLAKYVRTRPERLGMFL